MQEPIQSPKWEHRSAQNLYVLNLGLISVQVINLCGEWKLWNPMFLCQITKDETFDSLSVALARAEDLMLEYFDEMSRKVKTANALRIETDL